MPFILRDQRDADVVDAFRRYRQYVETERHRFPPGALALASSEWYFDPQDHQCPHDAWLQRLVLQETGRGDRNEERAAGLSIQLLGAYHDRVLTFTYESVFSYSCQGHTVRKGHSDWRFDEFRLTEDGHLVHEIEWCGTRETGRWLIEAQDVTLEVSHRVSGA